MPGRYQIQAHLCAFVNIDPKWCQDKGARRWPSEPVFEPVRARWVSDSGRAKAYAHLSDSGMLRRRQGRRAPTETCMPHVVERKLAAIVPLIVAGKMLPERRMCRVQRLYAFGNDLFTALAGLGLPPAVAAIARAASGDAHAAPIATAATAEKADIRLWDALLSLPPQFGAACLIVILGWIGVKIWLHQLDAATITTLSDNTAQQCRLLEANLEPILDSAKPMPELNVLHSKLHELRNSSITNKTWLWDLLPDDPAFVKRCSDRVAALVSAYGVRWAPAEDPDART